MENLNQDPLDQMRYERARKKVEAVSGFYKHLAAYILVNLFLLTRNYLQLESNQEFFTFSNFSLLIFWGLGVVVHAITTFGPSVFIGRDWEERKIREIMEREKAKKWE